MTDGEEDELVTEVGANEDETEWVIRVTRISGAKIKPNEFILELEAYLHDVSQSLLHIDESGSQIH